MLRRLIQILCLLLYFQAQAGRVDTLRVFSASMQKTIPCMVVVPDDYDTTGARYPVVYLLHGHSSDYTGWLREAPQLRRHADTYKMILVFPDGGFDSWYLDSPVDATIRYETHLSREVVSFIDSAYHTRADRAGRAIAGLSMGGHGALYLAIRNPEIFGAAGSMCGGLDLRPYRKNNWDLEGVLGKPAVHWTNWEQHSVVNLIPRLKPGMLSLILDCGYDDFFLDVNRAMHKSLLEAGIPHEYTERPGAHNQAYWSKAVDFQLVYFHQFFQE